MAALNAFLLANGLDVAGAAAGLHEAARPLLRRGWRAPAPKQALREGLVTYLGIQARAGAAGQGLPGQGLLAALSLLRGSCARKTRRPRVCLACLQTLSSGGLNPGGALACRGVRGMADVQAGRRGAPGTTAPSVQCRVQQSQSRTPLGPCSCVGCYARRCSWAAWRRGQHCRRSRSCSTLTWPTLSMCGAHPHKPPSQRRGVCPLVHVSAL